MPYNADFDGDEMNIHSPQTEEALAEAKITFDVKQNIISSKNNMNLVGTLDDSISGAYLLGRTSFSKADADHLLYSSGIEHTKLKGKQIEGKDVFLQVLPANTEIKIPDELTGTNTFGPEDGQMVKLIDKFHGRDATLDSLNAAFLLGAIYLSRRGFTLSLQDLNVTDKVKKMSDDIVAEAERKTNDIVKQYNEGSLEVTPGKTAEETREFRISQILNEVRTTIGAIVKQNFPEENNAAHIISSGAAGSMLNITQIGCCIGQQTMWNKRIGFGYTERTLSFFKQGDIGPQSRGFIKSSYFKGLKPFEYFFGAMTGRDSLMDTALRTPKSGYLYRRLVSALQDLKVAYDGTVRDASDNIVQFIYGDDGKDVVRYI
jgi:DNA-directed RNA polymerase subunit A'